MGRISHLIADLYFCGTANPLADSGSLEGIFQSVLPANCDMKPRMQIFPGDQGGWCGVGLLEGGRITFQTIPALEFMIMEIVAINRSFDPRALNEQLVALLAPSLITVDVFSRGHHLMG